MAWRYSSEHALTKQLDGKEYETPRKFINDAKASGINTQLALLKPFRTMGNLATTLDRELADLVRDSPNGKATFIYENKKSFDIAIHSLVAYYTARTTFQDIRCGKLTLVEE